MSKSVTVAVTGFKMSKKCDRCRNRVRNVKKRDRCRNRVQNVKIM